MYTVSTVDGEYTRSQSSSPIALPGLTNGTEYELIIQATDGFHRAGTPVIVQCTPCEGTPRATPRTPRQELELKLTRSSSGSSTGALSTLLGSWREMEQLEQSVNEAVVLLEMLEAKRDTQALALLSRAAVDDLGARLDVLSASLSDLVVAMLSPPECVTNCV